MQNKKRQRKHDIFVLLRGDQRVKLQLNQRICVKYTRLVIINETNECFDRKRGKIWVCVCGGGFFWITLNLFDVK